MKGYGIKRVARGVVDLDRLVLYFDILFCRGIHGLHSGCTDFFKQATVAGRMVRMLMGIGDVSKPKPSV